MKNIITQLIKPVEQQLWIADASFAIMRFICGMLLALSFGASKFGMPWTPKENNLGLFEVSAWFPEDVANYGGIFAMAPVFFAWMGAFSEAVGGLFFAFGLKTRLFSFLIMCTMLVAIFLQKWGQGFWGMLPAMGFLWISVYHLFLGSGKFGLDKLVYQFFLHQKS
ncbi:MAG: DoxX family protein [Bacteroidota bacterium]